MNLQEPLRRSRLGFDTRDQVLDIVVEPDLSWRWKDEDELAHAVERRVFSSGEAGAIRAEGERVVRRLPELVPTGWENWQPDPGWDLPALPADWDRLG